MREGPSINHQTMDLYQKTNYTKKCKTQLNDFYTIAMFCMIRIDIYVRVNSFRTVITVSKQQ